MTYLGINVNTLKSHRTVKLYVSTHWNCMAPLNHTCQHVEIALWNFTCQHVEIALWNHTCQHIEIASWNCSGKYIEITLHREIVHVNTLKSHRIVKSFMSTHWNRIAPWNCVCQLTFLSQAQLHTSVIILLLLLTFEWSKHHCDQEKELILKVQTLVTKFWNGPFTDTFTIIFIFLFCWQ